MKKYLLVSIVGFGSALLGLYAGLRIFQDQMHLTYQSNPELTAESLQTNDAFDRFEEPAPGRNSALSVAPDFVRASEVSTSSVVFVTTLSEYEYRTGTLFDWFFEPRSSQRVGSGSGVIFSEDGYIVTNNVPVLRKDDTRTTAYTL